MAESRLSRRRALALSAATLLAGFPALASGKAALVHKDPLCGCCEGWVAHLRRAGWQVTVRERRDLDAVKARLGVPAALASCHTAEIAGYAVEGHVPAHALDRLMAERPPLAGLAVPGMPAGSPGMEGGPPEPYDVVAFGPAGTAAFGRYRGDRPLPS
ncbi:MAG: DUF411 domain-containing protein [Alphaproteobacteria bacterium]|nr:DUF411 domain-containing protein [Alphaproteobacteria bacterium]